MFLATMITLLAFAIYWFIRLQFVVKIQEDLHNFIFEDPNCVSDYSLCSKQAYQYRLDWKQNELDSFDTMMIKFLGLAYVKIYQRFIY